MEVDVEREAAPLDVLAQVAGGIGLVDRRLQPLPALWVFVAKVDVGGAGPRGVRREDDSLDHLMRIVLHQDPVVERARLALVGVDAEIDRAGMILGQEGPLEPGGEAGAAAAAESRRLHHLDDVDGLFLLEQSFERLIAAAAFVAGNRLAIGHADGLEEDRFEWLHVRWPSLVAS